MSYTYYFLQYLFAVCYNDVFVLFQNYRFGSARFFLHHALWTRERNRSGKERIIVGEIIKCENAKARKCWRLCVLAYRCRHGTAPSYLAESLQLSTDVTARRRLWFVASPTLLVPSSRRSTLGDRSFPVAASRAWNSLPAAIRDTPSLLCLRRRLKSSSLFQLSFDC